MESLASQWTKSVSNPVVGRNSHALWIQTGFFRNGKVQGLTGCQISFLLGVQTTFTSLQSYDSP